MRTTTIAGPFVATVLVAAAGMSPASALPIEPSAISKAMPADASVVDVQWPGRYWGPRRYGYWGPRYRAWGAPYPYYSYGYPYYYRPYPAPYFSVGPRGFAFGIW
jgi:hypothetical protein